MPNTLPLFQATQSLNVEYTFNYHEVEAANLFFPGQFVHNTLYQAYSNLLIKRQTFGYKSHILDDINLATAAITLLFTDSATDEGYLGEDVNIVTLPLQVKKKPILTVSDLYQNSYNLTKDINQKNIPKNKQKRNINFNQMLYNNVNAFSQISPHFNTGRAATTYNQITAKIANSNFHESFHHSEQGIMYSLSSDYTIKSIVKAARANHASYFYGAVLDIYSHRTLCGNCNVGLLGMQHTRQHGFLANLTARLEKKNIQPRVGENTILDVRVSATKANKNTTLEPYRLCSDENVLHKYGNALSPRPILQALNKDVRGKNQQAPSYYYGNFFSSKSFSCKKLETNILSEKVTLWPNLPLDNTLLQF